MRGVISGTPRHRDNNHDVAFLEGYYPLSCQFTTPPPPFRWKSFNFDSLEMENSRCQEIWEQSAPVSVVNSALTTCGPFQLSLRQPQTGETWPRPLSYRVVTLTPQVSAVCSESCRGASKLPLKERLPQQGQASALFKMSAIRWARIPPLIGWECVSARRQAWASVARP